ncbi:MAG: hypothetical protein KIS96_11945 [Bauldia sp.]|nr:hypothetical protein [Bauldia sp.]
MTGTLYVTISLNCMGPVTDPRHGDLLTSWDAVDAAFAAAQSEAYRLRFPDSKGRGLKFSLSCVSWSGFAANPVQRDFGWHTIFDHYRAAFGPEMAKWGDDFYWMYNHPAKSRVGNEWGIDWFDNAHYLNILNHFVIDRGYFPNAIQVPTEDNDVSHFIEQWIPFDFGNRNSLFNDLDSINQDGKRTRDVFDWRAAPFDWSHYQPGPDDFRLPGDMKRHVFRIVDIKSIIHVIQRPDIRQAFLKCLRGEDVVICAYEHDFRDRYETIMELYLGPLFDLAREYPEIPIVHATVQEAARHVLGGADDPAPALTIAPFETGLLIAAERPLFGAGPYVCSAGLEDRLYRHWPTTRIGRTAWFLPMLPQHDGPFILGVAANDPAGRGAMLRYRLPGSDWASAQPLSDADRPFLDPDQAARS